MFLRAPVAEARLIFSWKLVAIYHQDLLESYIALGEEEDKPLTSPAGQSAADNQELVAESHGN